MSAEVVGSWFPSGYHGHYRNRTRADVINEYRNRARPEPPLVFTRRYRDMKQTNPFTSHDNKASLILDAQGFGQGVGKRKVDTRCNSRYNPEFFRWSAIRPEPEPEPISVNQSAYTGGSPVAVRKFYSRQGDPLKDQHISTYKLTYGLPGAFPNLRTPQATALISADSFPAPRISTAAAAAAPQTGQRRRSMPRLKSAPASSSVQECLTWHDMIRKQKTSTASVAAEDNQVHPEPQE